MNIAEYNKLSTVGKQKVLLDYINNKEYRDQIEKAYEDVLKNLSNILVPLGNHINVEFLVCHLLVNGYVAYIKIRDKSGNVVKYKYIDPNLLVAIHQDGLKKWQVYKSIQDRSVFETYYYNDIVFLSANRIMGENDSYNVMSFAELIYKFNSGANYMDTFILNLPNALLPAFDRHCLPNNESPNNESLNNIIKQILSTIAIDDPEELINIMCEEFEKEIENAPQCNCNCKDKDYINPESITSLRKFLQSKTTDLPLHITAQLFAKLEELEKCSKNCKDKTEAQPDPQYVNMEYTDAQSFKSWTIPVPKTLHTLASEIKDKVQTPQSPDILLVTKDGKLIFPINLANNKLDRERGTELYKITVEKI